MIPAIASLHAGLLVARGQQGPLEGSSGLVRERVQRPPLLVSQGALGVGGPDHRDPQDAGRPPQRQGQRLGAGAVPGAPPGGLAMVPGPGRRDAHVHALRDPPDSGGIIPQHQVGRAVHHPCEMASRHGDLLRRARGRDKRLTQPIEGGRPPLALLRLQRLPADA
jgi:hypothetical protein